MSKKTRFNSFVAEKRGTVKTITENTTLTEENILNDGDSFIRISGAYTLTLPSVSQALAGVSLLAFGTNASSKVAVSGGFGSGGGSFDVVTLGAYKTTKFYCSDESTRRWYCLNATPAAT